MFINQLSLFIERQEHLISFVYGLVYFLMGVIILLQSRELSRLKVAKYLWLLGVFGIVHGIADWGPLFIPLESQFYNQNVISDLWFFYLFLLVTSFVFLFYFGTNLVAASLRLRWLNLIPLILTIIWAFIFWYYHPRVGSDHEWRYLGSTWARYLLALPGTTFATIGLCLQLDEVKRHGFARVQSYLKGAIIFFILYSLFAGIVVPQQVFFPASFINTTYFDRILGLPIELFRAISGVGIAYFVIRYLEIFRLEINFRLQKAEKVEAILLERERISRSIHDGSIQSMYGLGMLLDHCRYLLETEQYKVSIVYIDKCIDRLNETIAEIREFIIDQYQHNFKNIKLIKDIETFLNDFEHVAGLKPKLTYREDLIIVLTPLQRENLYMITKELLWNIARHATASQVTITIIFQEPCLLFTVADNGKGFDPSIRGKGRGLSNVQTRVDDLGGQLLIDSKPDHGTRVSVSVPVGGGIEHDARNTDSR